MHRQPNELMIGSAASAESKRAGERNFRFFWGGQAVSTLGDAFAFVAIPLLVLDATGSVTQMGYVTATACGGQIAMSLVAGIIVDRSRRRRSMMVTDVGRMLLYGVLALAGGLGSVPLWLIYAVAGSAAALGNLFSVGYVAAIPNIVAKDEITRANGRLQATQALTYAIGPMLAGAACTRFGASSAIACDAVSFGLSAVSLSVVRFRQETPERSPATHGGGAIAEVFVGLRFVAEHPVLRAMVGVLFAVALLASAGLNAAVIDLLVFHLRSDLGKDSQVVGICLGFSALGALAGALAAPRLRKRIGFASCFLGGTGLQGAGLAITGAFPGIVPTLVGATMWAAGLTLRAVVALTLRQEVTPDSLLGRVTSATWTLIFGAATLGAVIVTHLASAVGTGHALLVTGGVLCVVAAAAMATPLAHAK
jgi:MFS family permease